MSFDLLQTWKTNMFISQIPTPTTSSLDLLGEHLLAAIVFSTVGIVFFSMCLFVMDKITPFSIIKEIFEEHNTALAIIAASIVLGISIIIGAAILG